MESVELLECLGCSLVFDQWNMIPHAISGKCRRNRYAAITPNKKNILRWFINDPKHVIKLYIQDFREKLL